MPKIIVSDSSSLILFIKIGELDLLQKVFGKIHVTKVVADEIGVTLPYWVEIMDLDATYYSDLHNYLDRGEASSLALTIKNKDSLLIIDEKKGRKIAKELGVSITGSLGIILLSKQLGYVEKVKPVLDKIRTTNFRINPQLIKKVLQTANEDSI